MAGCDFGFVNPTVGGYCVGEGKGTAPKDLGDSAFDQIAQSAADAAATTVRALGSAWTRIETPTLTYDSGPVAFLHGSTLWFTSLTAVLCLLIAAGQLAWQRRSEPGKQAVQGLLNLIVVSSAGVAAVNLLTVSGDKFSVWVIDRSTGCQQISASGAPVEKCVTAFDDRVSAMLALGGTDSSFLVLIMALLVIVGSLAQIALMIVRVAMLVILTGTLPLGAAASSTPAGRAWFRKSIGWLLAFVLYKPTAAIVYAAAFAMSGSAEDAEGGEIISMVSGVVLLTLACFTLPALLRLASPVAQSVLSGSGRGSGSGSGSGGKTVATGAQSVPNLHAPAAGRSVSGATLARSPGGHSGAGEARGRQPARGATGTPSPAGGDATAAGVHERTRRRTADSGTGERRPGADGQELRSGTSAGTGDEDLISSTPARSTHHHHDEQQGTSGVSD